MKFIPEGKSMSMTTDDVYYKRKSIPEEKQRAVEELSQVLTAHQVVGIVRLEQISSKILQQVKKQLRGEAVIKVAKNSIKTRAIEMAAKKSKNKNLLQLKKEVEGSNAFIMTNMNPFRLSAFLSNNKVPAPAKFGMIAPEDVVIPAANTGIQPGPVISEFGAVGIPTQIDAGQIKITKDTTVVRKGEKVSKNLAVVLSRLKMEPFELGLEMSSAYDAGVILNTEDLTINYEQTFNDVQNAHKHAMNLSLNQHIPTTQTIKLLITKATLNATNLSLNTNIPIPQTIKTLLGKSRAEALLLGSRVAQNDPKAVPESMQ